MSDVISLSAMREKRMAPPKTKKTRKNRGIGVLIKPAGSRLAFGVLGGNASIIVDGSLIGLEKKEFNLSKVGEQVRKQLGITLNLDDGPHLPEPTPPAVA